MDELETRLAEELESAAAAVTPGAGLDERVAARRRRRGRRQALLVAGAGVVAVVALVAGVLAFTGDEPTTVETVGDPIEPEEPIWAVTAPAPTEPRTGFVSAWTGEELLTWGGWSDYVDPTPYDDGAGPHPIWGDGVAYHPVSDTWRRLPPAPIDGRADAVSTWTGEEWVIAGGYGYEVGGAPGPRYDIVAYDPATDTWRSGGGLFTMQAGRGALVPTPAGVAAVNVDGPPGADIVSNNFLIDPGDLSWTPLLPITGGLQFADAAPHPGGDRVHVVGIVEPSDGGPTCDPRCLWELPTRPWNPSLGRMVSPDPVATTGVPTPPLLLADDLLVGRDGIYDPGSGGRPSPRTNDAAVTSQIWTGEVVVGVGSHPDQTPSGPTLPPPGREVMVCDDADPPTCPTVDSTELSTPSERSVSAWWQYDPRTGAAMDLPAPPDLHLRAGAQAVWTGEEVLIWGDSTCAPPTGRAALSDTTATAGEPPGRCRSDPPATGLRLRPPPLPSVDPVGPTTATAVPTTAEGSLPSDPDAPPTTATTSPPSTSEPSSADEIRLARAGTSFGMCAGYCIRRLNFIEPTRVTMTATGWPDRPGLPTTLVWTTQAELTDDAVRLLRTLLAALDPDGLEETYGCPDCADGGAAWVELATPEGLVRSTYDYGGPPEQLEALDLLVGAFIESLSACEDSEHLIVDPSCTPLPDA